MVTGDEVGVWVTHQDQGLQPYVSFFGFSAAPVRFCGPGKSSVPDRVQLVLFAGFMVVSQPLVVHGVGGQDVDDLRDIELERVTNQAIWFFHQPHLWFSAPIPIPIRITFPAGMALDPSSRMEPHGLSPWYLHKNTLLRQGFGGLSATGEIRRINISLRQDP